jgi:hypothetical protein
MTLKSIVTVEVDDTAFQAFKADFQTFQNAANISLGMHPSGSPTANSTGSGGDLDIETNIADAVVVLTEIRELVKQLVHGGGNLGGGHGGGSIIGGGGAEGESSSVLSFLRGGMGKLALGAVIGGLALAVKGGQFVLNGGGMSDYATDATGIRSAARGSNVSIGTYRAFQTDLAPYVDGEALLHHVAQAQSDITNPGNILLQRLGVDQNDTAGGAFKILDKVRDVYKETRGNPLLLQSRLQQEQLDRFGIGTGDARQLGAISDEEYDKLKKQLPEDAQKFQVDDGTAKVWQDLNQSLAQSRAAIETTFLKTLPGAAKAEEIALTALTGKLIELGDVITKTFPGLTADVNSDTTLGDLGKGLERDVGLTGDGNGGSFEPNKEADDSLSFGQKLRYKVWEAGSKGDAYSLSPGDKEYQTLPKELSPFGWPQIADALGQTESKGDFNAVSPAGAVGVWQVMPDTAKPYGYSAEDLRDPLKNADVSSQEWNKALAKYGDPMKAAAAYNWGQGNLDKDIKQWGDDWDKHLPSETQKYITTSELAKAIRAIQAKTAQGGLPPAYRVDIHNQTGSDAYIQGRQANRG